MRKRFEQSAVRLLRNIFRAGLFENPYVDPEVSKTVVGRPEYMTAGYEAQRKSVVLLKNKGGVLPLKKSVTVYIPKRVIPAARDWFGNLSPERKEDPVSKEMAARYFNLTDDPGKADAAIVFVKSPSSGTGYDKEDRAKGGNGYVPISLQYNRYTSEEGRLQSLAAGDPVIDSTITNRSYKGKSITATNVTDLKSILETKAAMNGRPVIVVVSMANPMVFSEFEKEVSGIVAGFGVQNQALLDIMFGMAEPSGLLPLQMPANMKTVENQLEDVPHDMECHTDSEGHVYDFAFGLNWKGVIRDKRTATYKKTAGQKGAKISLP
jgi:beta-glucosidase